MLDEFQFSKYNKLLLLKHQERLKKAIISRNLELSIRKVQIVLKSLKKQRLFLPIKEIVQAQFANPKKDLFKLRLFLLLRQKLKFVRNTHKRKACYSF